VPRIEGTEVAPGLYRPLVTVELRVNGRVGRGLAVVDSGADRTMLPADLLVPAGVDFAKLPLASGTHAGAGGNFEVRVGKGEIRFRQWLVCDEFLVAEPGKLGAVLLGRSDFFKLFTVRYSWHRNPPTMDIDPAVPKPK
jgi:hypothetical protein